jgi:hypothetical protein
VLHSSNNPQAVANGPTSVTTFTLKRPATVSYLMTYHWNGGRGDKPGRIALRHEDGTLYGPWQTTGRRAGGRVHITYWECFPLLLLKAGTYTVLDSNPATWSHNAASGNAGIVELRGVWR